MSTSENRSLKTVDKATVFAHKMQQNTNRNAIFVHSIKKQVKAKIECNRKE